MNDANAGKDNAGKDTKNQLDQQIAQLTKTLEPKRDLWVGIDNAIEEQHSSRSHHYPKLSVVAAGFAVLGLTAWLTLNVNPNLSQESLGQSADGGNLNYVAELSQTFAGQKQALLAKYQDQQPAADNWRGQLQELDDAASAIKKVLDQDPTNAQLIKMLQQTYQQQLDLINAVNKSPWQQI